MEFSFIKYIEGPFSIDKDFQVDAENGKQIEFQMIPELKYRKDSDVVGCQMTFSFQMEGKQLMLFGFVLSVVIRDFSRFLKTEEGIKGISDYLQPLWIEVLKFARGVLVTKLYTTKFSNFFLPEINSEGFKYIITEEKPA